MRKPIFFLGSALILSCASSLATPTENNRLRVLPAGKVVLDGKIDDWDLSGGVFACDDVENYRDKMAVWMHAMYDKDYLYLLARFRDETPLNNPGQTIANYGWDGDSLQFRVITNPLTPQEKVTHWTAWQGRDGRDIMDIEIGRNLNEGHIADVRPMGAKEAFLADADGKGYVQEIAVPWSILTKDNAVPTAGGRFNFTMEPNFTIGAKSRFSMKDIFKANIRPDRVFTFSTPGVWGDATLESKNNIAPAPVRLADGREFKTTMQNGQPVVDWTGLVQQQTTIGFKNIDFDMPTDGYVSLNIYDKDGNVVRQLLNSAFFTKGKQTVKWDGLTTPNAKVPGQQVPAGDYTWKALYNTGIGLKFRGFAANGGRTPWDNGPGTNWGGDHGGPRTTASDGKYVYLGWLGAEAGKSVVAADLDGSVLWGNNRGGIASAVDLAAADGVLYVLGGKSGIDGEGGAFYKLNPADGSYIDWEGQESADVKVASLWGDEKNPPTHALYMTAGGGKLYLTIPNTDRIAVVDGRTGKRLDTLTVPKAASIRVVGEQLFAVTDNQAVQVVDLKTKKVRTVVTGLSNASGLAVSPTGTIYVGTNEPDNQIKVYNAEGKLQRTIGRKGGRQLLGDWQPDGFRFIQSISLASDGKLWVAEADGAPRRMSSWDAATGKIVKEYFGSSSYGALGSAISPDDPNVMVGQGCEWKIDPATGRATCVSVITRDGMENSRFARGSNGRLYLAVASQWAFAPGQVTIFERTGPGQYKTRGRFTFEVSPTQDVTSTSYWADANGDEKEQPEEVTKVDGSLRFSGWSMAMAPNLTVYARGKQVKVTGFTAAGAPIYDLKNPVALPAYTPAVGMGATDGLGSADDKTMLYNGEYKTENSTFAAYDIASKRLLWTYPNNFVGVHGSHNATPPQMGMIRGAYDIVGTAKLPDPIGNVWAISTNVGEWHLLSDGGFYLAKLFQGDQLKVRWPDSATPGVPMDNVPPGMGAEDFGGSITYGKDGKLYAQAGKTAFWNLEVTGIDTVKALPSGKVTLTAQDLPKSGEMREALLQRAVGKSSMTAKKFTPNFTGKLDDDFKPSNILAFQKIPEAAIRSSAAWDDQNLYLGWQVNDNTPWQNAAKLPEDMYLYGDTVDFQLGTDPAAVPGRNEAVKGDFRLSIGSLKGTPTAIIYRPVSDQKKPLIFSSGIVKEYKMDYVGVIPDAKINVVKTDNGYTVEASIPFASLGWKPDPEHQPLRGDFGATHSGQDGGRTRLRTYWNNQQTGLVDDAVFEIKMQPANWGDIYFNQ